MSDETTTSSIPVDYDGIFFKSRKAIEEVLRHGSKLVDAIKDNPHAFMIGLGAVIDLRSINHTELAAEILVRLKEVFCG